MRKGALKERGKVKKSLRSVFLLIAEGKNKTETLYFSNYQNRTGLYALRILRAGSNTDAESLYKHMIAKWKEYELSAAKGDMGIIVLDIDNDEQKAQKILQLMRNNKESGIEFIVSNPSFEIWFLLHFRYSTKQYLTSKDVESELKKIILNYKKNKDYFEVCKEKTQDAICNSKRLAESWGDCVWPSAKCNPRTDVGKLVDMLLGAQT